MPSTPGHAATHGHDGFVDLGEILDHVFGAQGTHESYGCRSDMPVLDEEGNDIEDIGHETYDAGVDILDMDDDGNVPITEIGTGRFATTTVTDEAAAVTTTHYLVTQRQQLLVMVKEKRQPP